MGSRTIIRIEEIAEFVVSGYSEENIIVMKKILKNSYITNGAQDSCISNTFNGMNQLSFNLMKLYQEASQSESPMKHNNGETIPFSNSIYMYPLNTFGDHEVDWLIYKGDKIPMWGYKHSANIKWHREMSFRNAHSIKMSFTKYLYDEETDNEWTEDAVFDSIGNLLDFKKFFYRRWNELHCATELDMKKKFTRNAPEYSTCGFPVKEKINNKIKNNAEKLALANLMMSEEYLKKDTLNCANIYDIGTHYGIKFYSKTRVNHIETSRRIKIIYSKIPIKSLIKKHLDDHRGRSPHLNPKDKIIGKSNKDGSQWIVIKKPLLSDNKIEYIINTIYGGR